MALHNIALQYIRNTLHCTINFNTEVNIQDGKRSEYTRY